MSHSLRLIREGINIVVDTSHTQIIYELTAALTEAFPGIGYSSEGREEYSDSLLRSNNRAGYLVSRRTFFDLQDIDMNIFAWIVGFLERSGWNIVGVIGTKNPEFPETDTYYGEVFRLDDERSFSTTVSLWKFMSKPGEIKFTSSAPGLIDAVVEALKTEGADVGTEKEGYGEYSEGGLLSGNRRDQELSSCTITGIPDSISSLRWISGWLERHGWEIVIVSKRTDPYIDSVTYKKSGTSD